MKRVVALCVAGVVALAVVGPTGVAFAAKGGGGSKGGGGGGGGGGGMARPPQVNPAVTQDQQAVSAAQTDLNKASQAVNDEIKKLTADFNTGPDAVAAKKALDDAMADQTKAHDAALAKLQTNATYKAAAAKEAAANQKVADLQKKHASQDAISDAASDALKLGGVTSKMEVDALASDADYTAAKQKVVDAKKASDDLKQQFTDSLKDNTDLQPLQKAQDDAQQKVTDAQTKLKQDAGVAMH